MSFVHPAPHPSGERCRALRPALCSCCSHLLQSSRSACASMSGVCLPQSWSSITSPEGNSSAVGRRLFLPSHQSGFYYGNALIYWGWVYFYGRSARGGSCAVSQQGCSPPGAVTGHEGAEQLPAATPAWALLSFETISGFPHF